MADDMTIREKLSLGSREHFRLGGYPIAQGVLCAVSYGLIVDAVSVQTAFDRTPGVNADYWFPVIGVLIGTSMLSSASLREIEMKRKLHSRQRRVTQRLWLMCTVGVLMVSVFGAFYHAHQVFIPPRLNRDTPWPGIALVLHVLGMLCVNLVTILLSCGTQ